MLENAIFERRFGLPRDELLKLSRIEREEFVLTNKKQVFYNSQESDNARMAANSAVLRAAPSGHPLDQLNGINIGAGKRPISRFLMPVDLTRRHGKGDLTNSLLSPMFPLPFRDGSLDLIVSVHSLEHVHNPIEVVLHWLQVLKPGGGIGIILPDWRYNWDARSDSALWGHKWNSEPKIIHYFFENFWKEHATLEYIDTLEFKIGFDVILRKKGEFFPFSEADYLQNHHGKALYQAGKMAGQDAQVYIGENEP